MISVNCKEMLSWFDFFINMAKPWHACVSGVFFTQPYCNN